MARVVLVTGGAGPNMGQAISRRFALGGDTVVVADVDGSRADAVAKDITGDGLQAAGIELNVEDAAACDDAIARVISDHGALDVLCLHAGGNASVQGVPGESIMSVTDEALAASLALNITGNVSLARPAVRHMVDRGSGVVMVTISEAGLRGGAGPFAYMLTKHAMVGLVRHIAWVFGTHGVRCNGICPGFTADASVGMFGDEGESPEDFMPRIIEMGRSMGADPYAIEATLKVCRNAPRRGTPQEIAEVYYFAASEAASFLNGAIIPVDAGWSAG